MLEPIGIGHVVLKVRDLDRSLAFYRDLLGFRVSSEMSNVMIFLTATGENHHDLALLRVGDSAPSPVPNAVGLYHVAIQLPDLEALRDGDRVLTDRGHYVLREQRRRYRGGGGIGGDVAEELAGAREEADVVDRECS